MLARGTEHFRKQLYFTLESKQNYIRQLVALHLRLPAWLTYQLKSFLLQTLKFIQLNELLSEILKMAHSIYIYILHEMKIGLIKA